MTNGMKRIWIRLRAWRMGLVDGIDQGSQFTMGITWCEGEWLVAGANEAYDRGVNCGQILRTGRVHSA